MFERFTKEARSSVIRAQEECRAMSGRRVGCEHLLLALLEGDGPAARALRGHGVEITALRSSVHRRRRPGGAELDAEALATLGIDLDAVREVTEDTFGEGALDAPPGRYRKGHIPFEPQVKKSLELSLRHAVRLEHKHISGGHVLLGLLHDQDAPAARLLAGEGVPIAAVRADVTRLITAEAA